ncbi:hypothetical protein F441_12117 [Phytophthora nicotianae CJ01A1]|uniref:Uncharacterized protein n=4 Tax=Phytophthora nicotianae TaxID=4792 RepID=W2PC20_PHYN3|nr:hypothetical protein PPTG_24912 [Phytophthora nicotianae INRA-310]ETI42784.1 hypothetical protein F443_12158 [Phytophthora nicotianae P1569]ETM97549.1 hypothetical protein PPTG_24912 [Phytophthora nicotianae INRA-310]ETO71415.1 hypothetical protein F444_12255 [Phytophthora nicotianae P1976]ETP12536.1 hypothetical protein F441_12117 [Phytophthora nicotianae CJ01A1]
MASDVIDVATSDSEHEEGAEDGSSSYQLKPSRLPKFPILIEKETTKENVPGVVSTCLNQNGVYKWNVTLSDGSTRLLECQELAEAIHFANTTGIAPE